MVKVRDLMTTEVVTTGPDESIQDALKKMHTGRFRRIPVVERGRVVGIITGRDIRQALNSPMVFHERSYDDYVLNEVKVGGSMTPEPLATSPNADIAEVAQLMERHKIGGLPVVDNGDLVGIITISDLMNYLISLLKGDR